MLTGYRMVGFIPALDLDRARVFYETALGLRVLSGDPFALFFSAGGAPLRIARVENLEPRSFTILGWTVRSIAKQVDALVKQGVRFERFETMPQDARGIWTSPSGAKVAWFRDSEGNMLSLTEPTPRVRRPVKRKSASPEQRPAKQRTRRRP